MITADIIKDSVARHGGRITSFILKYPRFIHAELMTHRLFSRNAASSRAISFKKMVQMVQDEIAAPEVWGAEQKGMQSGAEIEDVCGALTVWNNAMEDAVHNAVRLHEMGVHKSICNRLLEPFTHMVTLVTATEFENFFSLRAHTDAQPEFRILATHMLERYLDHVPTRRAEGEWHMPFSDDIKELRQLDFDPIMVIAGRCARLSYLTHDGVRDPKLDFDLAERLVASGHWSPFEHLALPMARRDDWSGNFRGWQQLRKMFANEHREMSREELSRRRFDMLLLMKGEN
jgi:hypothetical protein